MRSEDQDQESTAEPVGQTTTSAEAIAAELDPMLAAGPILLDQERKEAILVAEPVEDLEAPTISYDLQ